MDDGDSGCGEKLKQVCRLSLIQYPREPIIAPFISFFSCNIRRDWRNKRPDSLLINGTMRCRRSFLPFDVILEVLLIKERRD